MALHTGMRKGEILKLKWQDVNLRERFVDLVDTKNGDRAAVPLNETVVATLRANPRRLTPAVSSPDGSLVSLSAISSGGLKRQSGRGARGGDLPYPPPHGGQPSRDGRGGFADRQRDPSSQVDRDDDAIFAPVAEAQEICRRLPRILPGTDRRSGRKEGLKRYRFRAYFAQAQIERPSSECGEMR